MFPDETVLGDLQGGLPIIWFGGWLGPAFVSGSGSEGVDTPAAAG